MKKKPKRKRGKHRIPKSFKRKVFRRKPNVTIRPRSLGGHR